MSFSSRRAGSFFDLNDDVPRKSDSSRISFWKFHVFPTEPAILSRL
jgi:hypothetical protein